MSRDSSIFLLNEEFPRDSWLELLEPYHPFKCEIQESQFPRGLVDEWCLDGIDGNVFVDVAEIIHQQEFAPKASRWRVGIHCNGHIGVQHWFLYAVPLLAIARFDDAIFCDSHFPNPGVACTLAGVESRMRHVLPTRCDVTEIARHGLTTYNDPMWPKQLESTYKLTPKLSTQMAMRDFMSEQDAGVEFDHADGT